MRQMKPKGLVVVLLLAQLFSLPTISLAGDEVNRNEAAAFIKKKGACDFAAAPIYNGEPQLYSYKKGDVVRLSNDGMPILCVWNGVIAPGTINEKTGCMAGTFDLVSGGYYGLDPMRVIGPLPVDGSAPLPPRAQHGKCTKTSVLKLLTTSHELYSGRKTHIWRDAYHANYLQTEATRNMVGGTRTLEILVDVFEVGPELSPKARRSITMKNENVGRKK